MFEVIASTMMKPRGFEPQYETFERTSGGGIPTIIFINRRSEFNAVQLYTIKPSDEAELQHWFKLILPPSTNLNDDEITFESSSTPCIFVHHITEEYLDGSSGLKCTIEFVNRDDNNTILQTRVLVDTTNSEKPVLNRSFADNLLLTPIMGDLDTYMVPFVIQTGSSYQGYVMMLNHLDIGTATVEFTEIPEWLKSTINAGDVNNFEVSTKTESYVSQVIGSLIDINRRNSERYVTR